MLLLQLHWSVPNSTAENMYKHAVYILAGLLLIICGSRLYADIPNINRIYTPTIKTVLLHQPGDAFTPPVISLNQVDGLVLSFDDLNDQLMRYRYTIRHCTYDWKTTEGLFVSEYIDGISEEEILRFAYSFNTTTPYIHYTSTVPSRDLRPKISGNYLLIVYTDDPASPAFTRRFMVVEPMPLNIIARLGRVEDVSAYDFAQQLSIRLNIQALNLQDPSREVKLVIRQNNRWDNTVYAGKPRFQSGNELDYRHDPALAFPGGNEYRFVDIRSMKYNAEGIRRIVYDTAYQVWLYDDVSRATRNYTMEGDNNGFALIKSDDYVQDNATEADYAWVHFSLRVDNPYSYGSVHVFGDFTGNDSSENQMIYNPVSRKYILELLLKQGYYDFQYALRETGKSGGDVTPFEGNHRETENSYQVLVYLRMLTGVYDRLIGYTEFNSRSLENE